MPTSYFECIPAIIEIIKRVNPSSVLDVGIGRGKYGLLVREYVEGIVDNGQLSKVEPNGETAQPVRINKVLVDGLEIYEPYITDIQRAIYDKIYIGDILTAQVGKYDLYLIIDVIEHLEKGAAIEMLKRLSAMGKVLISTPVIDIPQGTVYGNANEAHISFWSKDDLKDFVVEDFSNTYSSLWLI